MGKASEKGTHTFAHIPIRLAQSHRLESEVFVCEPRQVSVLGGGGAGGGWNWPRSGPALFFGKEDVL